jgi:hypothetical protein
MILPPHCAAGVARQPSQWQAAQLGEATLEEGVASRFVNDSEWLVKEDRDPRPQAQDEPVGDARFGLRQGTRARILLIARCPRGAPPVGEVAIEINAVGVLARIGSGSVRVEVVEDPQIDAPRDGHGVKATGHRYPRALISVDSTHDQDSAARERISQLLRADRPVLDGVPEQQRLTHRTGAGGRGRRNRAIWAVTGRG